MARRHIVLISQIPLWSLGRAVGGPAFHQTLSGLAQRFDVSLVTPRVDYVDADDLPEGVTYHPFHHHLHGIAREVRKVGWVFDTLAWYTFQSSAWPIVRKLCRAGDVDLVYGYEIYGVPVARRAADRFDLPVVARFQGSLMSARRHERLAWLRYWKHLRALRTPADLWIMTNDGTEGDRLLRELGHPSDAIRFWMNGVEPLAVSDTSLDVRATLGIPGDRPLLLTVSRLQYWKRIDRAIGVEVEMLRRGYDADLVVVGSGPREMELKSLAAELGVDGHVHFVGSATREELARYYDAATLLLSLYDYSNLGNPAMEAMMAGTPVAALDVGGTRDLVHDGVNGLLLDEAEPGAIADHVELYIAEPLRADSLGRSARDWAAANLWDWDARMEAEASALEETIGRESP